MSVPLQDTGSARKSEPAPIPWTPASCRDDCLNQELFVDVPDAKRKIERSRLHYNDE